VTFNGRFFDVPVMELCCLRYGISVPEWFKLDGPGYTQPRNRYNQNAHMDVQDILTNFGANHMNGGLNLCAQLLGKPGKMGTKGDMVQDLWESGEHQRIDDYCICDALDTYFLFLRVQFLLGKLDLEREHERVRSAKAWIEGAAASNPALGEYLAHFREWQAPSDDGSPFVQ
jgi:predicted PolB exonuclease-like 3'-5' exonuclease